MSAKPEGEGSVSYSRERVLQVQILWESRPGGQQPCVAPTPRRADMLTNAWLPATSCPATMAEPSVCRGA